MKPIICSFIVAAHILVSTAMASPEVMPETPELRLLESVFALKGTSPNTAQERASRSREVNALMQRYFSDAGSDFAEILPRLAEALHSMKIRNHGFEAEAAKALEEISALSNEYNHQEDDAVKDSIRQQAESRIASVISTIEVPQAAQDACYGPWQIAAAAEIVGGSGLFLWAKAKEYQLTEQSERFGLANRYITDFRYVLNPETGVSEQVPIYAYPKGPQNPGRYGAHQFVGGALVVAGVITALLSDGCK